MPAHIFTRNTCNYQTVPDCYSVRFTHFSELAFELNVMLIALNIDPQIGTTALKTTSKGTHLRLYEAHMTYTTVTRTMCNLSN